MTVFISYKVLKENVIDSYSSTLKNWKSKMVQWENLYKVTINSKVQFSPFEWKNGIKKGKNWNNDKQDMLVFDIDEELSISDCQKLFKKYKYLISTTKSHKKEKKGLVCDRYRLCLPAINVPRNSDVLFRTKELMLPINDEQTQTLTAAFLGNDEAITIYNDGDLIDCHKASMLAEEQLKNEYVEKIVIDKDLLPTYGSVSLQTIKERLDCEIVKDILSSVGYELVGNKFKLREEERTESAKVYPDGYIVDYGGDFKADIFQLLIEYHGMSFREALRYCNNFI